MMGFLCRLTFLVAIIAALCVIFSLYEEEGRSFFASTIRGRDSCGEVKPYLKEERVRQASNWTDHDGTEAKSQVEQPFSCRPTESSEIAKYDDGLFVNYGDSPYLQGDWDGSPVVIEQHKLVFFTVAKVGCTSFKMLFRRIMGKSDWMVEEYVNMVPWNPFTNGLEYLYDYNRTRASEIMTSPDWTRAIFVREPKRRFLSAWLDKVMTH